MYERAKVITTGCGPQRRRMWQGRSRRHRRRRWIKSETEHRRRRRFSRLSGASWNIQLTTRPGTRLLANVSDKDDKNYWFVLVCIAPQCLRKREHFCEVFNIPATVFWLINFKYTVETGNLTVTYFMTAAYSEEVSLPWIHFSPCKWTNLPPLKKTVR